MRSGKAGFGQRRAVRISVDLEYSDAGRFGRRGRGEYSPAYSAPSSLLPYLSPIAFPFPFFLRRVVWIVAKNSMTCRWLIYRLCVAGFDLKAGGRPLIDPCAFKQRCVRTALKAQSGSRGGRETRHLFSDRHRLDVALISAPQVFGIPAFDLLDRSPQCDAGRLVHPVNARMACITERDEVTKPLAPEAAAISMMKLQCSGSVAAIANRLFLQAVEETRPRLAPSVRF